LPLNDKMLKIVRKPVAVVENLRGLQAGSVAITSNENGGQSWRAIASRRYQAPSEKVFVTFW